MTSVIRRLRENCLGHTLHICDHEPPLVFCSRCGAYAINRDTRLLRSECTGRRTQSCEHALKAINGGRHPKCVHTLIGKPIPF